MLHIKLGVISGAIQHMRSHHLQFGKLRLNGRSSCHRKTRELAELELIFQKGLADLTVLLDGTSADGHLGAPA